MNDGYIRVMELADVTACLRGIPHMSPEQGRLIYEHLQSTGARRVLEIGTAHGVGTAYMAAAGAEVVTVDHARAGYDPRPEETLRRAGVVDRVTLVRRADSSYNWWLLEQVEAGATFDFCYLDGSHNFTIDGLAVVLIEKLLVQGGWLLLDDLPWIPTIVAGAAYDPKDPHCLAFTLSEQEMARPHMQAVFDRIVGEHPSFRQTRQDGEWGWAQKDPNAPTRREVVRRSPRALAAGAVRRLSRSS